MVTIHDIEADGKTYIMEWNHTANGDDYITITEACSADQPCEFPLFDKQNYCTVHHEWSSDGETCAAANICDGHETYDFKEVE